MRDIIHFVYPGSGGGGETKRGMTRTEIIRVLTETFLKDDHSSKQVRLVGLIFGRPNLELVQKEIIPNLSYWHHRSGSHSDFFCIGFSNESNDFMPKILMRQ